ncbi:hypothetical protein B0F90DRAFT_432300 [Multifurca ochricompacta]|uniref:Uncharacterized protein n=1 Tax=Multifurca ochricompacta TaxID=376703 RepID=A0AAD4M420_9AGAM|nr:hypothetical protein B0F90DRAFT_432300 [Multifurca ochricompacta]
MLFDFVNQEYLHLHEVNRSLFVVLWPTWLCDNGMYNVIRYIIRGRWARSSDAVGMFITQRTPPTTPFTLVLRIQFYGHGDLRVSDVDQDRIQNIVPWLRRTLTSLRLPHPKSTNFMKPYDDTSIIDMYWDLENTNVRDRRLCHPYTRCT